MYAAQINPVNLIPALRIGTADNCHAFTHDVTTFIDQLPALWRARGALEHGTLGLLREVARLIDVDMRGGRTTAGEGQSPSGQESTVAGLGERNDG